MSAKRYECINCGMQVKGNDKRKCTQCRIQGCKHCILDKDEKWICKICSPPEIPILVTITEEVEEEETDVLWMERKFWRMELKRDIWRRDRGCVFCCKRLPFRLATIDHLIPQSKGGENTLDNLVVACVDCNSEKQDKLPLEFILTRK